MFFLLDLCFLCQCFVGLEELVTGSCVLVWAAKVYLNELEQNLY